MYPRSVWALLIVLSLVGCSSPTTTNVTHFITQKSSDTPGMTALLEGKLTLSEGCLRIRSEAESHAAIWPTGYSYSAEAETVLIHDTSGQTVVRVGETLRVGGGEVPQPSAEVFAQNYMGNGPCTGKHWVISDVESVSP